ncbi:atlastin-2-like [Amphibalanus amphitrite]|uniref:atlastin-2-like n=1 Tax=Amphibalanus amphitrite TaxID=1232801 RepID=UPI001C924783|nr:atlastin-2-like [Amphibalanus amphitrite]
MSLAAHRAAVSSAYIRTSDDVADKPVAVISVAGAFRTGKSFLLSAMSRYLAAEDKKQWRDVKKGSFTWSNGADSHTNGMFISPPKTITLDSGEEAVLFLLDTQGLFDDDSNMADATNIFALSTLLSSKAVFNLPNNLKSDDLDHLQLFAEIGRMARDRSNRTAFQNLLFLIRDWDHPATHPFGKQGGDALVKRRLRSDKVDLDQRRQHIEGCFANIEGFLMPHPGKAVARSSDFSDDDMDEEFATHLDELLTLLLSPDKIPLKMNGNRPVTCGELATLIRMYAELFQSGKLPEPKGILETVAEAYNTAAVDAELNNYVRNMNELLAEDAPLLTEEVLRKKHSEEKSAAVECLKNRDTIPDPTKDGGFYCSRLEEKIEEWLKTRSDQRWSQL